MSNSGRMNASKLVERIQRFMKNKDGKEFTEKQAQDYLIQQLFVLRSEEEQAKDPSEMMNYIGSFGPRKVCQYQFRTNDIVWMCKQCQRDETCVICNECYQASNHEGHDVYFYHSTVGGCCDCGDCDAWKSTGFCDKHGHVSADPVSYIPRDIAQVAGVVFDEVAEGLYKYATYVSSLYDLDKPRRSRDNDDSTVVLLFDEYHTRDEFSLLLIRLDNHTPVTEFVAAGAVQVHSGSFEECRTVADELNNKRFNVYVGYLSDAAIERRTVACVRFLHTLAMRSDGICRLIASSLDVDILTVLLECHSQLSKELRNIIYDLLMILMADPAFKVCMSIAYTQAYPQISRLYSFGIGMSTMSVYTLSVQFLNREHYVNIACFDHNFLKIGVKAVDNMLNLARVLSQHEVTSVNGNSLSEAMTKGLKHSIMVNRRYNPILGDLKIMFTNHRVSRYYLSSCLDDFMALLESYQYLHPQERALQAHVEYEDTDWMPAFNLTLSVAAMYELLFNWFVDSESSSTVGVIYHGHEQDTRTGAACGATGICGNNFTLVRKSEDGYVPSGLQVDDRRELYFNSSTAGDTEGDISSSSTGAPAKKTPPTVHNLNSVWKVLHTMAERCLKWEHRFRTTSGVGVTLPVRKSSGLNTAYGSSYGEDIQLVDLIEQFYLAGVGKRPRLLSFHIPLHRTLAYAIGEACKYSHLEVCLCSLQAYMVEYSTKHSVGLSASVDIPLFSVLFGVQIGLSMWSRNGQSISDQCLNYTEYPFCRIYKELDTLLIQFLLTIYPPDQFVSQLFYRFGVAEYVAYRKSTTSAVGTGFGSAMYDEPYLPALLDECLKYIVNLVTELPVMPINTLSTSTSDTNSNALSDSMISGDKATATSNTTSDPDFAADPLQTLKTARLLPILRRELIHKLVSGPCTYSALHECIAVHPDANKIDTTHIDRIIFELTIKNDNNFTAAPTYTLKKELYSEYDPCFPRIGASVHQKVYEARPKVTETMPIITRPFVPHQCFASVRANMMLAPVLLRVQRDLLYIAAAERCPRNASYQMIRDKWTMKCNDSVYGKVLQLLTLAVYVTQDLHNMVTDGVQGATAGAAQALPAFLLETPHLPTSESAFSMYMTTTNTATDSSALLPSLLHVLMDIYYANDPLDVNSKHWVLWLVEQVALLDPQCSASVEAYKAAHNLTPSTVAKTASATLSNSDAGAAKLNTAQSKAMSAMQAQADKFKAMFGDISDSEDEDSDSEEPANKSAAAAPTTAADEASPSVPATTVAAPTAAQLARERALKAMQANASNFAAMMDGLSDSDSDDEDTTNKCTISTTTKQISSENVVNIGNSSNINGTPHDDDNEHGDEMNIDISSPSTSSTRVHAKSNAVSATTTTSASSAKTTDTPHSTITDDVPVCIICQADANTEGTNGNVRTLGYLALLQASTVLTHACADTSHMHVSPTLTSIHSKIAPKQLSSECNTHISFCGHGMHQDCFETYLLSQIRKATEQDNMVIDSTKYQYLCPLCKKLGNVFVPYVEVDSHKIELRESARQKAAAAYKKKLHAELAASGVESVNDNADKLPITFKMDLTYLNKPSIPVFPSPTALINAHTSSTSKTVVTPSTGNVWSWLTWIRHPSLLNHDLSLYSKLSQSSVSFHTDRAKDSSGASGSALKRTRSATSDCTESEHVHTKPNINASAEEVNDPHADYALNGIDLNSTSTDRNQALTLSLTDTLRGISLERLRGSFDDTESAAGIGSGIEGSGMGESNDSAEGNTNTGGDASRGDQADFIRVLLAEQENDEEIDEDHDPSSTAARQLRQIERHKRNNQRIMEALMQLNNQDLLVALMKRKAWNNYLEESTSVVYSDLSTQQAPVLETRSYMPPVLSYAVIVPALQVVIRSIAYTNCVDISEHNLPGYHLIPESAYNSISASVSGEKAGATSDSTTPTTSTIDSAVAPWCYIKKYSVGMDEYRYLGKTIDAVACTLQTFDCLDLLNHSCMLMLTGGTYASSVAHSPTKVSAIDSVESVSTWLPLPLNATYSSKVPIQMRTTPLLAAPLLDVLVFSMALAISAPSAASPPVESPTRSRIINALHNVQYNPVWNIDHCVRWLCMAKLVQLLYADIEESITTDSVDRSNISSDVNSVFGEWSSVAPFLTTLYSQLLAHYATTHSLDASALTTITTERVREVLLQWLAFIRAAVHLLYRNDSARYSHAATSTSECIIAPPTAWLNSASESLLVQNPIVVTDAQIVKHLTLVSMTELLASSANNTSLNSAQEELFVVCMQWVEDYTQHKQHVNSPTTDNVGVLTHHEVSDWIRDNTVVTKPPANATSISATTIVSTNKHNWPSIRHCVYNCYPRATRPGLISLPREYTKLHALVMGIISNRAGLTSGASPNKGDGSITSTSIASVPSATKIDNPAMCLVCGAIMDGAGKGQCAAHTMQCCGEAGVFFLVQECQVLFTHGPRSLYFASPYVDVYGESQHQYRGKPLYLDPRRYEALTRIYNSHQIPREVVSKRSNATRIIINNYY